MAKRKALLMMMASLALAVFMLVSGTLLLSAQSNILRITTGSDESTRLSQEPSLNADGTRVAFYSDSDFLGQGNIADNQNEIWLYNTSTMTFTRVTTASDGSTRDSISPSLSATGNKIAFQSTSDFLGQSIPAGQTEIWLYDTSILTLTRVTTASAVDRDSQHASISANGNKIAFDSNSDFLGQGIPAGQTEIWLYDTTTMTVTRVTTASNSTRDSLYPTLNAAGTKVAFYSSADLLNQGNITTSQNEIWLYDTTTMTFTRVTTASDESRDSWRPRINADGTKIAFQSDSDFLGQGNIDENQNELWLYDIATKSLTRMTTSTDGTRRVSQHPSLNADGSIVAFSSDSDLLGQGNIADNQYEIWLYDTAALTVTRATISPHGSTRENSRYPSLNADGTKVAFQSDADFLGQGISAYQDEIWYIALAYDLADVTIHKQSSATTVAPGDTLTYTLDFANNGYATANSVVITDALPAEITVQSVISSGDVAITLTNLSQSDAVFETAPLVWGQAGIITITAQVTDVFSADSVFTNTAIITSTTLDGDTDNNEDAVSVQMVCFNNIVVQNNADSGGGSLRQALIQVCDGGSITFAADMTITLNSTLNVNKSVRIDGSGQSIMLDGNNAVQIINIQAGNDVSLNTLTLQNGYTTGDGAGIYSSGTLTITNGTLRENWAGDQGGGLYAHQDGGSTLISNTHIISNAGWGGGGGLYTRQAITIVNSAVNSNTTANYGAGVMLNGLSGRPFYIENSDFISNTNTLYEGGGLHLSWVSGTIQNSHVLSNTSLGSDGGGIYLELAIVSLLNSEVAYNQAESYGGGIDVYDETGHLTVFNSTIHHNESNNIGGGLYSDGGLITVSNTSLAYNVAANEGGGIHLSGGGHTKLINSTISQNQATTGGAVYIDVTNSGGSRGSEYITTTHTTIVSNNAITGGGVYLRDSNDLNAHIVQASFQNSLIANNSHADCIAENGWELLDASLGYNLDSDGTCIAGGGTGNQSSSDPKVADLGNYGGETETHALLLGSPAIDAIPNVSCLLNDDQRGISRPQNDDCDIGAFESQGFYLSLLEGDNQETAINSPFPTPLGMSLVASDTNVLVGAGYPITLTAPSSGASLISSTLSITTTSNGLASAIVTANASTGSYSVTAQAIGASNMISFALVNKEPTDVTIIKQAHAITVIPGGTLTYTLAFSNISAHPANNIIITDTLPAEISVQNVSSRGDVTITHILSNPSYEVFELDSLAAGEGGLITLTAQVTDVISVGSVFTNTATISTTLDADTDNNKDAVSIQVVCANSVVVQNAADSGSGSLRQALSNVCADGSITFAADMTITLNSTLNLSKSVRIDGAGQQVRVDGNNSVGIFNIEAGHAVTLSHLSIVNGYLGGSPGAGIANAGTLWLEFSTIANNYTTSGGGGLENNGTAYLKNNTFTGNVSTGSGGAAIRNLSGVMLISNTTFTHNRTNWNGAAVFNNQGLVTMTHSTAISNVADQDKNERGSGTIRTSNAGGTTVIRHSLVAGNLVSDALIHSNADCGRVIDGGYNLFGDDTGCPTDSGTSITIDPTLVSSQVVASLGNYGGQTETFALLPGSPAIDAIPNSSCLLNDDQRDVSRPQNGKCDIGAFESQGFSLTISGGDTQGAEINTLFSQPLAVTITANVITEPVGPGGVISFTAPISGASVTTSTLTATTNNSGSAEVSVTANNEIGDYEVSATAIGATSPITFNLHNYTYYTLTTAYTGPGSGSVTAGGIYTSGFDVVITATENAGSYFVGWSGDVISTTNPLTVTLDSDKSITATFDLMTYTLTVNTDGDGSGNVTITPDQTSYDYGTVVTLTASADVGSEFTGWSGDVISSTNPLTVTMTADKSITATFDLNTIPPPTYTLTVNTDGDGAGNVTVTPDQTSYDYGTVVTLTASADVDSEFTGWLGDVISSTNPLTVTMTADKSITATFDLNTIPPPTYTLTVNTDGDGAGNVTVTPDQTSYDYGTVVTLTASADVGSEFTGWSGDETSADNPITVTMTSDKAITATFKAIRYGIFLPVVMK